MKTGVEHVQVVLSDSYGYPNPLGGWPRDAASFDCWESVVEQTVRACLDRGMAVEYDIWNEPNIEYFWGLDRSAWLETWRRGALKVRQVSPGAAVVGPSISGFDLAFLREFLSYAKENNCLPDVLAWHELSSPGGRAIPTHVEQARALLAELEIDIHRFSINEIIPQKWRFSPGTAISYFVGIENSPVESACHSCWSDATEDNCENASLNGLLSKYPVRVRSAWWAYKFYADTRGQKINVAPSDNARDIHIDVLAACDVSSGSARIILGSFESATARDIRLNLVALENAGSLAGTGRLRAVIEYEYVPDLEKEPIDAPLARPGQSITITDFAAAIDLPDIPPGSAFLIQLTPAEGPPGGLGESGKPEQP